MAGDSAVRHRAPIKREKSPAPPSDVQEDDLNAKIALQKAAAIGPYKKSSQLGYKVSLVLVTIVAFCTRFWKINHPDQVVFDEVHFGKVSSGNRPHITTFLFPLNGCLTDRALCIFYSLHLMYDSPSRRAFGCP